ncbi:MAG: DUF5103 domain-containing protein [Bacteroidales bacterium]|nr:DUF5103 domain-containing protein [Bacteroidales bacterium]
MADPIIQLGSEEELLLSFDEIENNQRTLYYSIRHYNIDWTPSDLLEVEIIDGFNRIYDNDQSWASFNTTTDYIHYSINIPTSPILHSGNYTVTVYDDEGDELLTRPFLIYEPIIGIQSRISRTSTVVASSNPQQSLSIKIIHPQIHTSNAASEFRIAIWQNLCHWTWTLVDSPTFIRQNELVYDDAASFSPGNEYHWADNRSLKYNGLNVAGIEFHAPYYHITLAPESLPAGYYFHEDFNGRQYIEARDIYNPAEYAADYNFVHFIYLSKNIGDIAIYGELTNYEPVTMQYNQANNAYYANIFLKQGLHSYSYVALNGSKNDSTTLSFSDTDGSFADTENDYFIAVYYREMGDTNDRLVGFKKHNSKTTINDFIH